MPESDKVEHIISKAFGLAKSLNHEYVTIEHLLVVLLEEDEVQHIIGSIGHNPDDVRTSILTHVNTNMNDIIVPGPVEPRKTTTLERTFNRAFTQALFNRRNAIQAKDLFLSILAFILSFKLRYDVFFLNSKTCVFCLGSNFINFTFKNSVLTKFPTKTS